MRPLFGMLLAALFALGLAVPVGQCGAMAQDMPASVTAQAITAPDCDHGGGHDAALTDLCRAHCQGLIAVLPIPVPDVPVFAAPHRYVLVLSVAHGLGRTPPDGPPPKA